MLHFFLCQLLLIERFYFVNVITMLLDSAASQTELYHSHRVFISNATGEKSLLCVGNTLTLHPEMMPHVAHEPASSKQSLLNIGNGSDSG